MDELWDLYLQHLIWRCRLENERGMECLFSILHNIMFRSVLERDRNREDDGLFLRERFQFPVKYERFIHDFVVKECSVMEVLVALAIRADNEIVGDPAEGHPEKFFMEMIKNLGLYRLVKRRYDERDVNKIIQRWLSRRFESDGRGSPFPVRYDYRDQRGLEIWDQMNSYISENYI